METLSPHILYLLYFSSLLLPSTSYRLPERYYINCGSSSTITIHAQNYIPDNGYLSSSHHTAVEDTAITSVAELYKSARKFTRSSSYNLHLDQNAFYMVRFHFFPLPYLGNLSQARFNVSASGFSLLSDFSGQVENSQPPIQDFILNLTQGKFKIDFVPYNDQSFAYVNAIEVFQAPPGYIPENATYVTPNDNHVGLLKEAPLHVVRRVNMGAGAMIITPENDTMLRYWSSDDQYLLNAKTAKDSQVYGDKPRYQNSEATATEYDAPDFVYRTAKENANSSDSNITWSFDVRKDTDHLVRLHFCDILSRTSNEFNYFNLYIYNNFRKEIRPYSVSDQTAVPFYLDFVIRSDASGFVNISVGQNNTSDFNYAFMNGVEIMEVIDSRQEIKNLTSKRMMVIIVGSSLGGGFFLLVFLIMFVFGLRKKKWIPIDAFDWPLVPYNGGSSHSRTTVKTSVGSTIADLHLRLKIPLSEILTATKHFSTKMMIGGGGFGKVYKGVLRNGTKVAVKRSEPGLEQGLPEFNTEIMVLSKIRHQHLVSLIGYCDERNEMILVYEFMQNGTLRDHLYNGRFSWEERLRICIGAAKGLNYLHSGTAGTIIHRDIKSTNILLDENFVAKVADFGLSRLGHDDQSHVSTEVKGSFGYLDPEYFKSLQLTHKSDVYSFGVVLLEVLCARPVIDNTLPKEQANLADWGIACLRKGELEQAVDSFLQGKINPNSLSKFGGTVEKCLEEFGDDRPDMGDVLWDLEYCMKLQQSAVGRQVNDDSMSNISWGGLPVDVIQRLPSNSNEGIQSFTDVSQVDGSHVFSLLNIDEAR